MSAAAYVGRVGGLAVALGIGTAVVTGHGVAWADSPDSDSDPSSQNSPTDTTSETSSPSQQQSTTAEPEPEQKSDGVTKTTTGGANSVTSTVSAQSGSEVRTGNAASTKRDLDQITASDDTKEPIEKPVAEAEHDAEESIQKTVAEPEADAEESIQERVAEPDGDAKSTSTENVSAPNATPSVTETPHHSDSSTAKAGLAATATKPKTSVRSTAIEVKNAVYSLQGPSAATVDTIADRATTIAASTVGAATAVPSPPMMTAALSATETAGQPVLSRLVTSLLSAVGLGALANMPGAPLGSPLALALLGWATRREDMREYSALGRTVTTPSEPVAAAMLASEQFSPTTLAAAATTPTNTYPATTRAPQTINSTSKTVFIDYVTGPTSLNRTTDRFGIGGTDLGIMWDNGMEDDPTTTDVNEHQVLIAFGDTFGGTAPVRQGDWRINTLFRSPDNTLTNGLYVPNGVVGDEFSGSPLNGVNHSGVIIGSPGYAIGPEVTIIPTAGISAAYPLSDDPDNVRQYVNFMSVRSWDTAGRWTTNYSGIAYSDDNGQTWTVAPTSIRPAAVGTSTQPYVSGNQNFQQGAFVKPPEGSPEAAEGWVYSYGTPSGRAGTAYLSRVKEDQILDQTKYEYWNGSSWVSNNPAAAKPVLPGTTSGFWIFKTTTYPSVSEMSVQYNPSLKKYVMLYADQNNNIVMRKADAPQGPWSTPTTLVTSTQMPGLYAPMIHPWSGTENVPENERQYLYWNLSTWDDYQVRLMRTDLSTTSAPPPSSGGGSSGGWFGWLSGLFR